MFDFGIDGEVEFKDNDGKASGKRIYIQLKSGNSYLRTRKAMAASTNGAQTSQPKATPWVPHSKMAKP